jgi:anti-sigma factor RsiW
MSQHQHEEHKACHELLSSLGEYVDGSLSAELCSALERHMKGCQRCTVVVNTLRKTVELYQRTSTGDEMPDEVRKRLYMKFELQDYLK